MQKYQKWDYCGNLGAKGFAVARYNEDGTLDETFGTNGKVRTVIPGTVSSVATSVVIQKDGKIVVGGSSLDASSHDLFT